MGDLLQSPEVWIALFTGGAVTALINHIVPAIVNWRKRGQSYSANEKDNLRTDIEYLRGEINSLRSDLARLRVQVEEKDKEISVWQRRYWSKKLEFDRVLLQVRHHGSDDIKEKVRDIINEEDLV